MIKIESLVKAALLLGGGLMVNGCAGTSDTGPSTNGNGDSGVAVIGTGGADVHVVHDSVAALGVASFAVTGPQGYATTGVFFVGDGTTIATHLADLPALPGYSITLTATSADGRSACTGASSFAVAASTNATVSVDLACGPVPHTGSALGNGTPNVCPTISYVAEYATSAPVGGTMALEALAVDADSAPSALTYTWMAAGASLTSTSTRSTVVTCTTPGTVDIGLVVSDGDALTSCHASQRLTLTCLPKTRTTIAAYGDWPYSAALLASAPKLVASINGDADVQSVLFVGDIHSGSMICSDAWNVGVRDLFQTLNDPLVYTPGDNEWTDCQKVKEMSSGAPLAELAKLRSLFFPTVGQSLGANPRAIVSQATAYDPAYPADAAYVENSMWTDANVVFATLNFPGSNNDTLPWNGAFSDPVAQADEVATRTAANIRWLNHVFAQAGRTNAAGILLGIQADMWDPAAYAVGGDGLDGYTQFVRQLAALTVGFGRPVLLVNGDSHVYGSDRPLADPTSATGVMHGVTYGVPNLTRITVEGSTAADEWVKIQIDANSPTVFSWSRVTYVP